MKQYLLIVPLFLVDCGSSTRPPPVNPIAEAPKVTPSPPVKEGPVDVTMRVLAMTSMNPDPHEILNGEALRTGDKVALTLKVDQLAYIYVAEASSDGTSTRIYPDSGDVQTTPDNLIRIPREGHWLKLDQHTGQESFFVYGAKQAIPAAILDAHIKSDADAVKIYARAKSPKPNVTPAPGATVRSMVLVVGEPSSSLGSDGVIRRRFTIQHRQ